MFCCQLNAKTKPALEILDMLGFGAISSGHFKETNIVDAS